MNQDREFYDPQRYERWDGSEDLGWDADSVFDALSEDLLRDGDIEMALQRAFRWGFEQHGMGGEGLKDMLQRLRNQKQQLLDDYDFGSVFGDAERRLQEIVDQERSTVADRRHGTEGDASDEAARSFLDHRLEHLDRLPKSPPDRIESLRSYEFVDQDASAKFQELLKDIQSSVMDAMFDRLMSGGDPAGSDVPGQMAEFLADLNSAFDEQAAGGQPDLDRLNNRWADKLGGRVESVEQLRQQLQGRQAAAQALLNMLTPEQRSEVLKMMNVALKQAGIEREVSRLQHHLGPLPQQQLNQSPLHGQQELPLDMALQVLERAAKMEKLENDLQGISDLRDVQGLDPELVKDVLSDEDRAWLDRWSEVEQTLADAGIVKDTGRGLELTPQAIRKIGQHALIDIFTSLKSIGLGDHDVQLQGRAGELGNSSSPWQFGDPFVVDLPATVRSAIARNGPGTPVRLASNDFQVIDREARTSTATVLLVDMSRSMLNNGCWDAAKRTALALDSLIRSAYPRDVLELFGFSATAHPLTMKDLPTLEWNQYNYGTNLQHALELARKRLRAERGRTRQIIVITDGEPTAHFDNGQVQFNYPPTKQTFEATLREVVRCTREEITINTFLLERTPYMEAFIEDLMRINRGRVINASPNRLGRYVLKDFLSQKTRDRMDA